MQSRPDKELTYIRWVSPVASSPVPTNMSKRSESLSSEAVGLAYLMFGLIVRRNPFLAEPFVPHRAFAGVSASRSGEKLQPWRHVAPDGD